MGGLAKMVAKVISCVDESGVAGEAFRLFGKVLLVRCCKLEPPLTRRLSKDDDDDELFAEDVDEDDGEIDEAEFPATCPLESCTFKREGT